MGSIRALFNKYSNEPKVLISIGIVFIMIGIAIIFNFTEIGTPVKTIKSPGNTVRYWATEKEKDRAEWRKLEGGICVVLIIWGIYFVIKGYSISKASTKPGG